MELRAQAELIDPVAERALDDPVRGGKGYRQADHSRPIGEVAPADEPQADPSTE